MSHAPLKISIAEAHKELDQAWRQSYSPKRNESVMELLKPQGVDTRVMHLLMRLFFRGIYVPQMTKSAWLNLAVQNRRSIFKVVREGVAEYRRAKRRRVAANTERDTRPQENEAVIEDVEKVSV